MKLGRTMNPQVLFVSPFTEDAVRLTQMLRSLPIRLSHATNLQQAHAMLDADRCRVILTEADLPDGSWLDLLSLAQQAASGIEVIVTDAFADARFWAEALNLGAYDLLVQPFHEAEVRRILSNACTRMLPGQPALAAV